MSKVRKSALLTAATAITVSLATPAASADMVDDYLAKVPAGQISCDQASRYYTNASDYNSKKSQALAAANFHPRGGEIRDAIARADEAIARCGLNGGAPAPKPAPAPAPKPAPAPANVISVGVVPGQPTVDVPVGPQVFRIPDINKIIQDLFSQAQSQVSQLSSF
ncbi:hypothetical protein HMPREF3155_11120 [Corynebacterium sp. HMSC06D04]|mgnify:CR=1 FL=1|uniref:hypothetical protein n=1 Tax=Corynebacterium TaxID=1716 RepID=UPI0008B85B7C|nr:MULTISPECIES: hypothetical protein [Corynebacterium]KAA1270001.1 hypothetical protein D7S42_05175 [Corynebacterium striatum]MCK6161029.1 hypothetical protein [Corynebacterium simulans]MDK8832407.1 hypothetical protein [Corynebacterium striatum]MDK8876385.1 hypothetical protein [Corynebacterium striatum]MDU3174096.1 hypothetical protein [Corynebacterium striatum]